MIDFRASTSSAVMSRTIRVGSNTLDHRSTSYTNGVLELGWSCYIDYHPQHRPNVRENGQFRQISRSRGRSWQNDRATNVCWALTPFKPFVHASIHIKFHSIAQSLLYDCIGLVTPHQTSWVEELDVRNREFTLNVQIYCNPTKIAFRIDLESRPAAFLLRFSVP